MLDQHALIRPIAACARWTKLINARAVDFEELYQVCREQAELWCPAALELSVRYSGDSGSEKAWAEKFLSLIKESVDKPARRYYEVSDERGIDFSLVRAQFAFLTDLMSGALEAVLYLCEGRNRLEDTHAGYLRPMIVETLKILRKLPCDDTGQPEDINEEVQDSIAEIAGRLHSGNEAARSFMKALLLEGLDLFYPLRESNIGDLMFHAMIAS